MLVLDQGELTADYFSAVFHLNSEGSNMTTLWATEAGLYVGIDNRGNIVTSVSYHRALTKLILSRNEQKTQSYDA